MEGQARAAHGSWIFLETMNALQWAEAFLRQHVTESAGENRGPVVDAIEQYAELPLGSPWCAAFVWYCFHKAELDRVEESGERGESFPGSGGSQSLLAHFEQLGLVSRDPQDLLNWKGALGGWTDPGGAHGHVFFIKGRLTDEDGKVVKIATIEGNAGPGRGGVVALVRDVPTTAEGHDVWFLNVSEFVGGSWWE